MIEEILSDRSSIQACLHRQQELLKELDEVCYIVERASDSPWDAKFTGIYEPVPGKPAVTQHILRSFDSDVFITIIDGPYEDVIEATKIYVRTQLLYGDMEYKINNQTKISLKQHQSIIIPKGTKLKYKVLSTKAASLYIVSNKPFVIKDHMDVTLYNGNIKHIKTL